jgi:hypothetical protein
MNDATFDNDDNPYGKFILHQYTNMNDINDTGGNSLGLYDREIPLIECAGGAEDWRNGIPKYYCPDFDESHILHGSFYADKYSWLRLAIHVCDPSP